MFRLFSLIVFLGLPLVAVAQQSPMMTNLRPVHALAQEDVVMAMVHGLAACAPGAALPEGVLAPLGVRYLTPRQVSELRLLEPERLKDRSVFVLMGNDPVNTERDDSGRYHIYGAKYRLRRELRLGPSIYLQSVATMVVDESPRSRIGVTYFFAAPAEEVMDKFDRMYGLGLRDRLDKMPDAGSASVHDVWITLGQGGKALTCWRFTD